MNIPVNGSDSSANKVEKKIYIMIQGDSTHPLSDQKIFDVPNEEGIEIARRAVAKYREQMNILSARYRKSL